MTYIKNHGYVGIKIKPFRSVWFSIIKADGQISLVANSQKNI